MVCRGRSGVSEYARCFLRCAQCGQPEATAIGAYATDGPGIVSLIRIAAVFRYAAAMIELSQISDGFLHRRPHGTEKGGVLASGEHEVAIDHQYKFRIQILPVVGVLPSGFVDVNKRVSFRHS